MTSTPPAPRLAKKIRQHVLYMTHASKSSHIGSCFSAADILAVLYSDIMRIDPARPDDENRDRLIVSKGHAAAIVYAVLAERGFFPVEWLSKYARGGSPLMGHVNHDVPGVELSTGSLGHGLSVGAGLALAAKRDGTSWRTFVVLSDGELDEGSIWEAALFAGHHGLDNLTAIVDYNKLQGFGRTGDILNLEPLADKWRAFGWAVREIDGHSFPAITDALGASAREPGRPTVVVAHTIKGKGISFMEDQLSWHYKSLNDQQLEAALAELADAP